MRVRRWESLADGVMDSAVAMRMESLRAAEKQEANIISLNNSAITRAYLALVSSLIYLDLRWRASEYQGD